MIKTGVGSTKRITDDEVKEVLKINDDALHSIQLEHRLGRSLNDFFNGRITKHDTGETSKIDVDDYCSPDGIKCPSGYTDLEIYSRKKWKYPFASFYLVYPTLETNQGTDFGLSSGEGSHASAEFRTDGTKALIWLDIYWDTGAEITNLLPANYATVRHTYQIKVNKSHVLFFVDYEVIGVLLFNLPESIPTWENNLPYVLKGYKMPFPAELGVMFEVEKGDASEATLDCNLFSSAVLAYDGDPLPPRQYAIYTENSSTKWAGSTFSDTITSHPVPVWGYPKKCFLFQSNAAGTIAIEVYAGGGWREVVSETVTTNELWDYVLNLEVPIARMKYTPANSDSIAVAECNIS